MNYLSCSLWPDLPFPLSEDEPRPFLFGIFISTPPLFYSTYKRRNKSKLFLKIKCYFSKMYIKHNKINHKVVRSKNNQGGVRRQ
jgi:hypothetical protein